MKPLLAKPGAYGRPSLSPDGPVLEGRLRTVGIVLFALIIAGLIIYTVFLVMEIRRNEQQNSTVNLRWAMGDTTLDLESAARAGVRWNIGVLSGAHAKEALERAPHTHLLDSVADLLRVF